jgi:hypothetical protein
MQATKQGQLINRILNKRPEFDTAERYYKGTQGEVFYGGSDSFRRDLSFEVTDRTTCNFMRPVVDNVANRLEIEKVVGESEAITNAVEKIRIKNKMTMLEKEINRNALVMGEYYAMVWVDKNDEVKVTMCDPRDTVVIYDADTGDKVLGARTFYDQLTNSTKLNIFYTDRVEKYGTKTEEVNYDDSIRMEMLSAGADWILLETMENPFGEIPLFHFRTHGETGRPEHFDGYSIQDSINKLTNTHMITVDFQGAPQRYALRNDDAAGADDFDIDETTDRENAGALKASPGGFWDMVNYKEVGQLDPAKPEVFTSPVDHMVKILSAVTNTPLHYFQATGNVPSGDALRAAEGPLLKKVADRQVAFGITWDELYTFSIKVDLDIDNADLVIHWKSVETLDGLDVWDIMAKKRNVGMPFKQVLIEAGYDNTTINAIIEMKKKEDEEMQSDYLRNSQAGKATNTNPEVRTNLSKDETSIPTE